MKGLEPSATSGRCWPPAASIIAGVAHVIAAAGDQPGLDMLALHAATGGADFVIQSSLLARRRRLATVPA
jgi:hypothetical protein